MADVLDDGTLSFLPVRLNNQPVVMGGLTADEMWGTVLISAGSGLVLGIPVAILTHMWALIIAGALVGGVLGLTVASRVLRRMKRGRPDTWIYRQVQLNVALHFPAWNSSHLITRTGAWTCRRTEGA
ncbi:TIGR03750 family conjugal transfer protein [Pseudomonas chlororaphis]|uniref:TIGR03750 family conjugal transfer protein n=1 Tax=Pseudomonas chlororaphis TaxID=587753 RepID=UPI0019264641|nr:TIGR03750 family conjugal transfer protein [Pseudomonas chlororaphis]QQX57589.1 TIGR03750 family conjugal transfer protein [Pseudomonas chlororaphis subsp. aurantiaca]